MEDQTHRPGGSGPGESPVFRRDFGHILGSAFTDSLERDVALTETKQKLAWLSQARLAFIRHSAAVGLRPVLVSPEHTRITEPLRQALLFYRGGWAVRGADGTIRNGMTGRRLSQVDQAVNLDPVEDPNHLAMEHLQPAAATHAHLLVAVTLRHPPGPVPLPGEAAEIVLSGLTGSAPTSFGCAEPALRGWDAAEIGWLCDKDDDRGLPASTFVVSGGPDGPASLVLRVQRSADHTAELMTGLVSLGRLGDPQLPKRLAMLDPVAAALSRTCETSFALFSARPGDAALTHASAIPNAPVPLSIILGGGLITGLGIDTEEIAQRFRASRTPHGRGLVVPLDSGSSGGVRLADLLRAIEFYRATPHMGITQPQLQAVRYAARY